MSLIQPVGPVRFFQYTTPRSDSKKKNPTFFPAVSHSIDKMKAVAVALIVLLGVAATYAVVVPKVHKDCTHENVRAARTRTRESSNEKKLLGLTALLATAVSAIFSAVPNFEHLFSLFGRAFSNVCET
jgi:hypothetical protein